MKQRLTKSVKFGKIYHKKKIILGKICKTYTYTVTVGYSKIFNERLCSAFFNAKSIQCKLSDGSYNKLSKKINGI